MMNFPKAYTLIAEQMNEFLNSINLQNSSSNMLLLTIEDILVYA